MQQEHVITSLAKLGACRESLEWAERYPDPKEAWFACESSDWLMWLLEELKVESRVFVKIAVACAKRALQHVPDGEERPANAIALVELWLAGEEAVTKQELLAAVAASSAATDAAYAAYVAAARAAASFGAADAARAAAAAAAASFDAARAAYDAAHAAADAAARVSDAAADAAYTAARAAADAVSYAAHVAADARAAERLEQCNIIRDIVSYDTISELLAARFEL